MAIKSHIQDFYLKLYKELEAWSPDYTMQEAPTISNEDEQWLQREFEEEEVLNSVKLCASDKAHGPDGFLTSFYQSCWEFLKDDIVSTKHNASLPFSSSI